MTTEYIRRPITHEPPMSVLIWKDGAMSLMQDVHPGAGLLVLKTYGGVEHTFKLTVGGFRVFEEV